MKSIFLSAAQIRKLEGIAKGALPNESCAFLLGHNDKVKEILEVQNSDESPVTFRIESKDLLNAYYLAESKGLQVIAIFHSHPTKPWPSSTDVKFMEINPIVWVIYSTTDGQLKAFIHDDNLVKEVHIRIIDARA
jgi:[CysO sulfur-carrier protein]-S-L-cysteine hydrolase